MASLLPSGYFARYSADHPKGGQEITRDKTCDCGRAFTQSLLSERFLAACERRGIVAKVQRQIPEFYVPVFCPACERKDLGQHARAAEYAA